MTIPQSAAGGGVRDAASVRKQTQCDVTLQVLRIIIDSNLLASQNDEMGRQPPEHPFIRRLSRHVELTSRDLAELEGIMESEISVPRKSDLVVAGSEYRKLCFVKSGYALRYQLLRNGKRHILNVILPGDVVGVPNSFYERAAYPVTAINAMTVSFCRLNDYVELCYQRPQFAFALCWLALQEATTHAERVVGLSRRTPLERLSHFLLELHARLNSVGLSAQWTFALPLSQEVIADVLGLSTPHLNRVMQQLKSDKLIAICERRVELLDPDAIKSLAHYNPPEFSLFGQRSPHVHN